MARPMVEINPLRGIRLKQILEEQKTSQKTLSEKTGISQQAISAMVNGKASVTETTAQQVVKCFPEYRFEWIMAYDGEDRFPTQLHKKLYPIVKHLIDKRNMYKAVEEFLSVFGLSFQLSPVKGVEDMSTDEFMNLPDSEIESVCKKTNDVLNSDNAYQLKSSNGEIIFTCSSQEREDFIRDIYEYTEFKLNKMIERKGNNNGNHS